MDKQRFFFQAAFLSVLLTFSSAWAQDKDPPLPAPIQNLVDQGAQIRYLGKELGLNGWITIRNGQEQYFYVTPDGEALLMGLLFDKNGKMITLRQVKELQEKGGDVLKFMQEKTPDISAAAEGKKAETLTQFKTPSEQLFDDVTNSNWIPLGDSKAPVIYSFVDPQCPHCHDFMKDLRADYINNGLIQVRIIPVGFKEETKAQAAFLLAAPEPQDRWFRHLDGDKAALPVTAGVNIQGVEKNMSIMQSWRLDVTPLTVYRAKDGQVKIVQGRASNTASLINDLPPKQ